MGMQPGCNVCRGWSVDIEILFFPLTNKKTRFTITSITKNAETTICKLFQRVIVKNVYHVFEGFTITFASSITLFGL